MNNYWNKLSPRERRLATITAAAVGLCLCLAMTTRAVSRIRELNDAIDRLEQQLLNDTEQDARGVSVDKAFAEVAAQHSSAWTESEIFNRLRQEIYRLRLEDPNAQGGKNLVEIPALDQGKLSSTGQGYREYQLTIRIPATSLSNIVEFLVRLQKSAQSLRIDGLALDRAPDSLLVAATIDVTRTVVDGPPPGTEGAAQASGVIASWDGSRSDDWQAKDCDVAVVSQIGEFYADGGNCLQATAKTANASLYMARDLQAGATYEMDADIAASGPGTLHVANQDTGQPLEGEQALTGDGNAYRYRVLFTVPGTPGKAVKMGAPHISLAAQGARVWVDNVVLTERVRPDNEKE